VAKLNKMKNNLLKSFIAVVLFITIVSNQETSAQIFEITPFAGYTLGGKANLYDGEFRIADAMNYGGKLAFALSTTTFVEFTYSRADTEGQFFSYYGGTAPSDIIPFSSNYIQIGGLQEMDMGILSPFVTLTGGLAVWSSKSAQLGSYTQFSITLGGGTKIWITDNIGIRLQASMLMPMVWGGTGIGCGIGTGGSGCGANVYTRITPFQGEFIGGLIIKINTSK
jgi:hypothetical protein